MFGDTWGGGYDWRGTLEGVVIYDRVLSEEMARGRAAESATRTRDRVPAPRAIVRAKVVEASPVPAADRLREYPRALVVHAYEVTELLSGDMATDRILVARWAYLDRRPLASPYAMEPGRIHRLKIEAFEEHPQLDGERLFHEVEDFDSPMYYDVGGPPWP
jgi:hypothetical protein